jgi:hypothetical protein
MVVVNLSNCDIFAKNKNKKNCKNTTISNTTLSLKERKKKRERK